MGSAKGAAACEAAGKKICERACACSNEGKCSIGLDIGQAKPAGMHFDNDEKCRDWYVTLGCYNGGEPDFDYGKCHDAVQAASCVDAAGDRAIMSPPECKINKK